MCFVAELLIDEQGRRYSRLDFTDVRKDDFKIV
jgi:hypothetical protein